MTAHLRQQPKTYLYAGQSYMNKRSRLYAVMRIPSDFKQGLAKLLTATLYCPLVLDGVAPFSQHAEH